MNELEGGLSHHSLITDEELKKEYKELLAVVREEYEDINQGRGAEGDQRRRRMRSVAWRPTYIESVRAYTQHERVRNRYTGRDEEPDERLMRSDREKINIPDSRKDDFRQENHELHRRPWRSMAKSLNYKHQCPAAQGAGAQVVRGQRDTTAEEPG